MSNSCRKVLSGAKRSSHIPRPNYLSASVAQLRLLRPDGDVDGGREREKDSLRDVQADQTYSDDQYSKATALQDSVVELMVWTNKGNCFDEWNLGAVGNIAGGREGGSERERERREREKRERERRERERVSECVCVAHLHRCKTSFCLVDGLVCIF